MPSQAPFLEFNYDISCPFAYIASTRISSLARRTNAQLSYRPVLLGAIYRETSAPQGAGGSASDVFNPTKRAVTSHSMSRTLARYKIKYNPPPQHPRKSVNALRLLYCVPDGEERRVLSEKLFEAYWVTGRDVTDVNVLLEIANESKIRTPLTLESFKDSGARKNLESATADAIARGAFGVPGFWIPGANDGQGRFFWGQDRMHFVEATLLSGREWHSVPNLQSLVPHCMPQHISLTPVKTRLEFWFDFSSPWAFLGWTQLARLQRQFRGLEIVLKPFLLGILFREIGAPNMPMLAISEAKAAWSWQDHEDWTKWWNAVNVQGGEKDRAIAFQWAEVFPIRTPTVLRVGIVEPETVGLLYSACWEQNANVSDEAVLANVLTKGGYNGSELVGKANAPSIKTKLREFTAEAKEMGICGVPTYRVLREDSTGNWKSVGGLVWGQDETNVVEDLIAGWDPETSDAIAEPMKAENEAGKFNARL